MEGVKGFHGLVPESFLVLLLTWSPKFMLVTPLFLLLSLTGHFTYLIRCILTIAPLPPSGLGYPLYIIQSSLPLDNLRNNLFFSLSLKMISWREQTLFYLYIYIYMNAHRYIIYKFICIIYIPEPHNNKSYHYIK